MATFRGTEPYVEVPEEDMKRQIADFDEHQKIRDSNFKSQDPEFVKLVEKNYTLGMQQWFDLTVAQE